MGAHSPRTTIAAVLLLAGCGGPGHEGSRRSDDQVPLDHGWDGWGDEKIGCAPRGDRKRVRGILRVQDLGKGSEGTVLETESGEGWIVDYRAASQHRSLAGKPLVAVGRDCDKKGQARVGHHFDIETVQILSETPRPERASCYPFAKRQEGCATRCEQGAPGAENGCAQGGWPLICNADGSCTPEQAF